MSNINDPRDASREIRLTLPKSWYAESVDALGSMGMFLAGMVMVTRNRYVAWPVVVLAINGIMNQHPLRAKEGGSTPWATLLMAVFALVISHAPLFTFTDPTTGAIRFS
ncbi:hypothetical protein HYDPIDRAFT_92191 [Hydnomerulius pinastri MD-312]|uniref:Unplaced genomic scaffold scaffold_16, whole genome shotgun sequence n=1 Tax=Hydnomerulius pinastri MD-312 TaxID=994086 RepID=A0A0C9W888_9AGAM|nr:hypothetical protein HYDPIDRAFT_92191 [Hydnomerulius pinastri MD-312]